MELSRRKLLLSTLFGAGYVGLRSFATGVPIPLLEGQAFAEEPDAGPPTCTAAEAQYLFLLTSASGDPLNCNVPGTYVSGTYHPADPKMEKTSFKIGGKSYDAAKPWTELPTAMLARTSFIHHGTYTNAHGDHAKVNRLQGAVNRQEMLLSLIAKSLAPCLATVQQQPVVISSNLITFNGAVMPTIGPPNLKNVLGKPKGPLQDLQKIRDTQLDALNKLYKETGNTSQRAMLDRYALSQRQARALKEDVLKLLDSISGTTPVDLGIAARVLFQMNVSPVVVANFGFGGDNHSDPDLATETQEHIDSIAALRAFYDDIQTTALKDKVTIALQNVFGRTLDKRAHYNQTDGRNHNANHHATVLIGSRVKGSVIGGITLAGTDFRATGFDSKSGASKDRDGDIPFQDTLSSVGKTLARAVGVSSSVLDTEITRGKVIAAALT